MSTRICGKIFIQGLMCYRQVGINFHHQPDGTYMHQNSSTTQKLRLWHADNPLGSHQSITTHTSYHGIYLGMTQLILLPL